MENAQKNTTGFLDPKIAVKILEKTYTKNQALRRLRLIKDFINFKFFSHTGEKKDLLAVLESFDKVHLSVTEAEKLKNNETFSKYRTRVQDIEFLRNLGEEFFGLFRATDLDQQFTELEKVINQTKSFQLYLPIEIPDEEIDRLGRWFKDNAGVNCLMELEYDPNLIGGCSISFNGVIKDYSLSQRLKQSKEEIIQTLASYRQNIS